MRFFTATVCLLLTGCSFNLQPRSLRINFDSSPQEFRPATRGLIVDDFEGCFYVSVKSSSTSDSVPAAGLEGMNASDIGIDGAIQGPYTKAELTSGVSFFAALAPSRLRVLGVIAANCTGGDFSAMFGSASNRLGGIYIIAESTVDFSVNSRTTLNSVFDSQTRNQLVYGVRASPADGRRYLSGVRVFQTYSGIPSSTVAFLYAEGGTLPKNSDGGSAIEIPSNRFLSVFRPVSQQDMGAGNNHPRFDIFFSANGVSNLDDYPAIKVATKGIIHQHFLTPTGCTPNPTSSPSYGYYGGIFAAGIAPGWLSLTSSSSGGGGGMMPGDLNLILTQGSAGGSWSSKVIEKIYQTPDVKGFLVSFRSGASPGNDCISFTLSDASFYMSTVLTR